MAEFARLLETTREAKADNFNDSGALNVTALKADFLRSH